MSDLIAPSASLPAMSDTAISKVRALETAVSALPQEPIVTHHLIHGGLYSRTITIPQHTIITGALIKVPTTLICSGSVQIWSGEQVLRLSGYNVLPGSVGRKCVFAAETDVSLTMVFPTDAKTVGDAEKEFTDEWQILGSHTNENRVVITGE